MAIALLAEVNRAPFDMPEAEQELTAGYHSEYSGMKFAMFFLAEYVGMIAVSMIGTALYFGGYYPVPLGWPALGVFVFSFKVIVLLMVMIWVRGTLPRIRYDRLMAFGWKVMLPLALLAVVWSSVTVILETELTSTAFIAMIIAGWVVFIGGAGLWFARAGRKPDPMGSGRRIEMVSISRRQNTALASLVPQAEENDGAD